MRAPNNLGTAQGKAGAARRWMAAVMTLGAVYVGQTDAKAQGYTLRMHQFLSPQAGIPSKILFPWAERVTAASHGELEIRIFSSMALGGAPAQLIDQVRDGVVDIVWTLPGYTAGRFPRTEVLELPFMMTSTEAASRAYWQLFESDMRNTEFRGIKVLGAWVHGRGLVHAKGHAITRLEHFRGKKIRGPTRAINNLLKELGATAVGMPVTAIPESIAKGVIDAAVVPWEVTGALRLQELVDNHTEFGGERAFYTATFVLAMNEDSYARLPGRLRRVIDDNSGMEFSAWAGRTMAELDAAQREKTVAYGNAIHRVEGADLGPFLEAGERVVEAWIADMNARGIDGAELVSRARELIARQTSR